MQALAVLRRRVGGDAPVVLDAEFNFSVPFYARSTARQAAVFAARLLAERLAVGTTSVKVDDAVLATATVCDDGLVGVALMRMPPPSELSAHVRVATAAVAAAIALMRKERDEWSRATRDFTQRVDALGALLATHANPMEVDALARVQGKLRETREELARTIESVLERGEKMDVLMKKSEDLSAASREFLWHAKKTRRCCST
jgi:synaptobrevin family protein YKT6